MRHGLIRTLICAFALAACTPVMTTTYDIIPPKSASGRGCAASCLQTEQQCQLHCRAERIKCEERARWNASGDYNNYVASQLRAGRPATMSERHFYLRYACPEECPETCAQSRRQCHTDCGGTVIPHTTCTANCK